MKDLIYYPSFESTNEVWLKFALLYIDKLNPIIPLSGDNHRSELYQKLVDETDLLNIHRPSFNEGYLSTLDAIDIVERIMRDPYRFDMLLGHYNSIRFWENQENWMYKLYEEKYSDEWRRFCIINNFALPIEGGLLISKELGVLYMTVLANTIADSRKKSPITDYPNIDNLAFFLKTKAPSESEVLSNAQSVVKLKLPRNIENTDINDIIKLRNRKNFKKDLIAFHTELDNFYGNIENGNADERFVKTYSNAYNNFTENILSVGIDTFNFSLGAGMLLTSPSYTDSEFFRIVVAAGTGLIVKSGISLKNTWKNTESKRHCRRYLTQIGQL